MKKSAIVAASLVLAAAISAWLARDRPDSNQVSSPVADSVERSLSVVELTRTGDSVVESDTARADPPTDPASPAAATSAGPVKLFSAPDYGSIEYLNALNNANAHLANSRRLRDTRSVQLLKRDEGGIDELVRQLRSNPDGLSTAFEISPPNIHACTISSIEDRSPDFTPGVLSPSRFSVETTCDESGDGVTISVDRSEIGTVAFAIRSVRGGVSILSVDESGYAAVFQRYPFVPRSEN